MSHGILTAGRGQVGVNKPGGPISAFSSQGGVKMQHQLTLCVIAYSVGVVSSGDEGGVDIAPADGGF